MATQRLGPVGVIVMATVKDAYILVHQTSLANTAIAQDNDLENWTLVLMIPRALDWPTNLEEMLLP